jgi:hypothetical protein
MLLKKDTAHIQGELATYCRDGNLVPIRGANPERLPHYRRLVFNVVNGAMEQAYPITLQVLGEQEWQDLIHAFFTQHNAQSSQVWKLPYELYIFAREHVWQHKLNRPYLIDLLYFEWIEIEVYCMPDGNIPSWISGNHLLTKAMVVNPDFRILHLKYPVHKKAWKELESAQGSYFVLVFREPELGKVKFIELSPFFALLFERLTLSPCSAEEALHSAATQLKLKTDPTELFQKARPFFEEVIEQRAVLGFLA